MDSDDRKDNALILKDVISTGCNWRNRVNMR